MPPRPVQVYPVQNLNFGAFFQTSIGGSVILFPSGLRSVTGGVVEVNQGYLYYPAMFDLEANVGTLVNVMVSPEVILTGSNGGQMTLYPGGTLPVSPFVTTAPPPLRNRVYLGGTLVVGNSVQSPPGHYVGTLLITVIQE